MQHEYGRELEENNVKDLEKAIVKDLLRKETAFAVGNIHPYPGRLTGTFR